MPPVRRLWLLTLILGAAITALSQPALAAKYPTESVAALQKQIKAAQVKKATLSHTKKRVTAKLGNGQKYIVTFPASKEPALVASMKAKGAVVHVAGVRKATKTGLRLRYIALIVLVVGGVIAGIAFLTRRRRQVAGTPSR